LKDIYYAEKKIFRTLPKMVKAAKDAELKKAFTPQETQGQIQRLEQVSRRAHDRRERGQAHDDARPRLAARPKRR
jgi:ferritin-like metal-binding protein YciE